MTPETIKKYSKELSRLESILRDAQQILITAPSSADGDSVGSQLAMRKMILEKYSRCQVHIINDEPLAERYLFLPDVSHVHTPETLGTRGLALRFDVGIIMDGGIDRAGRVKNCYDLCKEKIFIDHHMVSVDYPYTLKIVETLASSTTELVYYLSQLPLFQTKVDRDFAQLIYLGLIFDTGFFRYSNTTPELMELGAKLLRTGFNFTRVGERGMLERTYVGLKLLSDTISRAKLEGNGKIIWSTLSQETMHQFNADLDDREGIIDSLYLTHGIEVALIFFELDADNTKVSFRSQGKVDVAKFARSLTVRGGGHQKAAGANLDMPMHNSIEWVLFRLREEVSKIDF